MNRKLITNVRIRPRHLRLGRLGRSFASQVALIGLMLLVSSMAAAQTGFSILRGTATDPNGAVVPGAVASLTEVATNVQARSVVTDDNGNFELPDLKPGIYRLRVEKNGFKLFVADELLLETSQTRRLDIPLQIGGATEEVTVKAGAAVITTDSGSISGAFDQARYADKPLVDVYPSPFSMMLTLPGVQGAGWAVTVAGQSRAQMTEAMDGVANDRNGGQMNNTNFFQEVTVAIVNNTADSSRVTNYNMNSKRGQNQFHGMAFYQHYNAGLNARPFFDPRRTPFIQHEWHVEASGPIIKDRTFFYASWFGQKFPLGSFNLAHVPSLKMRGGNFSDIATSIRDPLTGQPFLGNIIPANRIGQVSANVQKLYIPEPNLGAATALTNNFGFLHPFPSDLFRGDWPFVRIDHNLTKNNSIYGRWMQRRTPYVLASGLPGFTWTRVRDHRQTVISDTHVFSNSLVNTAKFGWSSNYIKDGDEVAGVKPISGAEAVKALGLQGVNRGNYDVQGFPRMNITGFTDLTTIAGGLMADDQDFSFEDSLTWSKGRHVWKFGGQFLTYRNFTGTIPLNNYGTFNFNGSLSGHPYADFLLGLPSSSSRVDPLTNRTQTNKELGLFVMDTFKITPRLTLDLGLRWDYYALPTYEDGLMYNFDSKTGNVVVPQEALSKIHPLYPKTINIVAGKAVPDPALNNLRPRLAVAYRLNDKTVIRGGYGVFTERIGYFSRINGAGPFQIAETYTPNSIQNGQPLFQFPNPFPSSLAGAVIPSQSVGILPLDTDNGAIHQFNLSVEREIAQIGVRVSYVGSRSRGLNYALNINKPQPGTTAFAASRRPFPQFNTVTENRSDGQERYDSLQVEGHRRIGSFTFEANWTWMQNMANFLNLENPYDVTSQWARIAGDRRHHASISTTWAIPLGKGRRFLSDAPGIVDQILGEWNLQTISYLATGEYFTPSFSGFDTSNTGSIGGIPDRIRDGNLPSGERAKERWFDPTAFKIPGCLDSKPVCAASERENVGRFGNAGVNFLVGQGINVHHLSLAKRFTVTERVGFIFTTEMSNIFNHPHFTNPRNNISTAGTGGFSGVIGDAIVEKNGYRRIGFKARVEF